MVIPKGVPSSSLRAYLRPIETPDESTFEKTPALRNLVAVNHSQRQAPRDEGSWIYKFP